MKVLILAVALLLTGCEILDAFGEQACINDALDENTDEAVKYKLAQCKERYGE